MAVSNDIVIIGNTPTLIHEAASDYESQITLERIGPHHIALGDANVTFANGMKGLVNPLTIRLAPGDAIYGITNIASAELRKLVVWFKE